LQPNPQCEDSHCVKNQKVFQDWKATGKTDKVLKGWEIRVDVEKNEDKEPVHEDNEWGITLEDETPAAAPAAVSKPAGGPALPEGIQFAYTANEGGATDENVKVDKGADIDDLQAQLAALSGK